MNTITKQQSQLNQLITDSVEKLVKNISQLNEESSTTQYASPSTSNASIQDFVTQKKGFIPVDNSKKSLAFIEAQNVNEMNLVISAIKTQFPNVNLHLISCSDTKAYELLETLVDENNSDSLRIKSEIKQEASDDAQDLTNKRDYLTVSRKALPDFLTTGNSSSHKFDSNQYFRNNLSTNSCHYFTDRNGNSDRTSSIDNSSISSNNTSFERQESKDSGFYNLNKNSFDSMKSFSISDNSAKVINEQKQQQQIYAATSRYYNSNKQSMQVDIDPKVPHPSLSPNRNEPDSRKFLTSPTNFNRSSVYNWKKWKKGQAWRYNSISNLSENSANENSNHSFNAHSNSSSFSNEKPEDEVVEHNFLHNTSNDVSKNQGSSFGFSHSFENESSNNKSLKTESLSTWLSTSRIEGNDQAANLPKLISKKRRGKLMRDQTIDNGDEQTTSMCLNPLCVNPLCCKDGSHFSPTSSFNDQNEGSPLNLSRCVSPSMVPISTGRVSPPEKRVILETNIKEEIRNIIKQSLESLVSEEKINTSEMNVLMTNLIEQKSFMNSEIMQKIVADHIRQNSKGTIMKQQSILICKSPGPAASGPSPAYSASLINTVKQLSLLSLSKQDTMESMQKSLAHSFSQYDFYKELQLKMNQHKLDNNKSEDMENRLSPNAKFYMIKNKNSSSFESTEQTENIINPENKQSHSKSPIYRSNSSPCSSSPSPSHAIYGQHCNNPKIPTDNNTVMTISANDFLGYNIKNNCDTRKPQVLAKPLPEIVITESKTDGYSIDFNQANIIKNQNEKCNMYKEKEKVMFFGNEQLNPNPPLITTFNPSLRQDVYNDLKKFNNFAGVFNNSMQQDDQKLTNQENSPKNWAININPTSNSTSMKSVKLLKPHVCTNCQKRFARSDMLIRHSRLHSGIRPYRCNRCGQEFSRSDHLNTHLRTHTGEKPYSCPHPKCTYAACRKDMITRHLKVHYKNKFPLNASIDSVDTFKTDTTEKNLTRNLSAQNENMFK